MSDRIAVMPQRSHEPAWAIEEIYRAPQPGVRAEFIGETNIFTVRVERIEGGCLVGVRVAPANRCRCRPRPAVELP